MTTTPIFTGSQEDYLALAAKLGASELRTISSKAPLNAESLSDAIATAASFYAHNANPVITERWLFRPFVLTEHTMSWGSYTVPAPEGLAWGDVSDLSYVFHDQLYTHRRNRAADFEAEVEALHGYQDACEYVETVMKSHTSTSADALRARNLAQEALENALSTVFYSAKALHRLDAGVLEHGGMRSLRHILVVADECTRYEALFTSSTLELDIIADESTGVTQWRKDQFATGGTIRSGKTPPLPSGWSPMFSIPVVRDDEPRWIVKE